MDSTSLFRNPPLEITGTPAASKLLLPLVRCAGALSHITRRRGMGRFLGAVSTLPYLGEASCKALLAQGASFAFPATDTYWGFFVYSGLVYEYPLHMVFKAICNLDFQVLDCGANFGYWSVLLSSPAYGSKNVIAIEPAIQTFQILRSNSTLNGNRFACVNRAVSDCSGSVLSLVTNMHASARLRIHPQDSDGSRCQEVLSISLDDLVSMLAASPNPLVIKLDIEGHETQAIRTAACLRDRDVLIIYEDNASDVLSTNTQYILALREFVVYWIDDLGRCARITNVSEVNHIKHRRARGVNSFAGHNFLATTRDGKFDCLLRETLGVRPYEN
jgi:FkbM family methyltransferase